MQNECSCTQALDCTYCLGLELTGYLFIKDSGDKGVGLLLQERDQLRIKMPPIIADIREFLKFIDSCVLFYTMHEGTQPVDTKIQAVRDWLGAIVHDESNTTTHS